MEIDRKIMNMKTSFFLPFLFVSYMAVAVQVNKTMPKTEAGFIENKGQVHDQYNKPNNDVLYLLNTTGLNVQIKQTGFAYDTYVIEKKAKQVDQLMTTDKSESLTKQDNFDYTYKFHRIDIDLIGANPDAQIVAQQPLAGYTNYYNVTYAEEGILNVHSYQKVIAKNIYPGIDVEYLVENGTFKYNFIVHPGADYKQIKLKYTGAPLSIKNGAIVFELAQGILEERIPKSWYENFSDKQTEQINVSYSQLEKNIFGFEGIEIKTDQTLVLDPTPNRLWATYYSGSAEETSVANVTDASGNIYLCGITASTTNIATSGAHQVANAGNQDVFSAKFNTGGVRQWGTYYGGTSSEYGLSCAMDAGGNLYISALTPSSTNISTTGAHQTTLMGSIDFFLVKFNTSGLRQWGTYYGGTASDDGLTSCATDVSGNIYLAGFTTSTTNIATTGAHQFAAAGGYDAFLVKFNTSGVRQWGTYYGGTTHEFYTIACATNAGGDVYLAAITIGSTTDIATTGSHQVSPAGNNDAFLVKFNTSGVRQWGTYYGGVGSESEVSCTIDGSGNVYLSGTTQSSAGISTTGSHQVALSGGDDGFLVKFNSNGVRQWGTYYGGTLAEGAGTGASATDAAGNVYISGTTQSSNNMSTAGAYQIALSGSGDNYLAKFNTSGVRQWGTYCGGTGVEYNDVACSVDGNGNIYFSGITQSTTGISTVGSHQAASAGGLNDAYMVKFYECTTPLGAMTATIVYNNGIGACTGISKTYSLSQSITNAVGYQWTVPAGITIVSGQGTMNLTITTSTAGSPQLSVKAYNVCGDSSTAATLTITSTVSPTITAISTTAGQPISGVRTVCNTTSATFNTTGSGATSYTWTKPSNWSGTSTTASITLTVGTASDTLIVVGNGASCSSLPQKLYVRSLSIPAAPASVIGNDTVCSGKVNTFSVDSVPYATSYTWTLPTGWTFNATPKTDSMTILPTPNANTGSMTVIARNFCGASALASLPITVNTTVPAQPSTITGGTAICGSTTQTYSVTSVAGMGYKWLVPADWTIVSGQGTAQLTAIIGSVNGTLSVTAYQTMNPICEGTARTLLVTITAALAKPGLISGDTTACVSVGSTYSIAAVSGATSYTWTIPTGLSGTASTSSPSNVITPGTTPGTYTIKVKAVNGSCASLDTSLSINVSPAIGTVSIITGNTTMCANSAQKYSITQPTNATNYTWALPGGWAFSGKQDSLVINTIVGSTTGNVQVIASNTGCVSPAKTLAITTVSAAPVLSGNIVGSLLVCQGVQTTYSINAVTGATYLWTKNSGWTGTSTTNSINITPNGTSDTLRVVASNGSCNSAEKKVYITVTIPPAIPATVIGATVSCVNSTEIYKITKVTGASYYTWTYPAGWSPIVNNNDSFIIITAGSTSGPLSVAAVSSGGCPSTPKTSSAVAVSTTIPNPPVSIIGGNGYCTSIAKTFSVTAVTGATGYEWTVPTGWTINSGQNTTSMNVTPNSTPGFVTVQTLQGGCKSSIQQDYIGTVRTKPTQATINMTNTSPCVGTPVNIDCSSVPDADTYTWTLPSGWTMTSGNGNTFINAIVGSAGGNITVLPKNSGCDGTSSAKSATVSTPPTISGNIAGETYVKSNVLRRYSISGVTGVNNYTWQATPGWNIVGANNLDSVMVFTGNTTGILSVTVSNSCGSNSKSKQIFAGLASGIDEESMFGGLSLYPVPAKDVITLSFSLKRETSLEWRIINMLGQEVLTGQTGIIQGNSEQQLPITITTLPVGMYQLSISNGSQQKFIKFSTIK